MSKPDDAKESTSKSQKPKTQNGWGISAREFFDALQNKPVRVTTIDGKINTATLVGVDLYDIILKQGDGALILMPKHAIKLITTPVSVEEK